MATSAILARVRMTSLLSPYTCLTRSSLVPYPKLSQTRLNTLSVKWQGREWTAQSGPLPSPLRSFQRPFHLSPAPHAAPLPMVIVIAAKQVVKIAGILTARFARNRYRRKTEEEKKKFWQRIGRHRLKFWLLMASMGGAGLGYAITHLERTPLTRRLRFIALTKRQVLELSEMELANQLGLHRPNCISEDTRVYQNIKNIIDDLIKGNSDVPSMTDVAWKLHVVDRKDQQNAFVLSTGDIFVFTGLLQTLENNDEIACILAHEMAHKVLGHDLEKASRGHVLDLLFIALAAVVWLVLPSDLLSFITQVLSEKILKVILELPYGRQLEEEADEVGLQLAAKACFDVRSASKVWTMMFVKHKLEGNAEADIPMLQYFSTHPLDLDRAEKIDAHIPSALHKRKSCNCPPLPHLDPRRPVRFLQDFLQQLEEKEMDLLRKAVGEKKLDEVLDDLITDKHFLKMAAEAEKEKILEEKRKKIAEEERKLVEEEKRKMKLIEEEQRQRQAAEEEKKREEEEENVRISEENQVPQPA